jgi:hypothetical protein
MNEFRETSPLPPIQLSRRHVLRGLGTMMSAAPPGVLRRACLCGGGEPAAKAPLRAAWLYIPNGVNPEAVDPHR